MKQNEWKVLKEKIRKLPIDDALLMLTATLRKVTDKKVKEEIITEIKKTEQVREEAKEWKRTANPPQSSRLKTMTEEPQPRQRETTRQEESPLETVVAREQPSPEVPKQKDYLPSAASEYKSSKYQDMVPNQMFNNNLQADVNALQRHDYTPGKQEKQFESESERAIRTFDPMNQTEMYKKKKDSRL